jgi:hypothetical protein
VSSEIRYEFPYWLKRAVGAWAPAVQSAYAAVLSSRATIVQTLNAQIEEMAAVVKVVLGRYARKPQIQFIL